MISNLNISYEIIRVIAARWNFDLECYLTGKLQLLENYKTLVGLSLLHTF